MARRNPRLLFIFISLVVLAALAVPAAVGAANPGAPPPRGPTITPIATSPGGAHIALSVADAPQGAWHDVESWHAALEGGYQQWWLSCNHYGTGPFRWCVLAGAEGDLLMAGDAFSLPARSGEWVRLALTVPAAG